MKERLLEIFPEINEIRDAGLRDGVIRTWLLGLQEGGWQVEDLNRIPFTLLKNTGVSFADHVRAVTRTALATADVFAEVYGDRLPVNRDVLAAGASLHDVGKLLEFREKDGRFEKSPDGKLQRHPFSGVVLAARCGVPVSVQHIIGMHSKEGDIGKRTTEAQLLHHADFMNFEPFEG